jgi:hypothetical protein
VDRLFLLYCFLVLCNLPLKVLQLISRLTHKILQRLIFLLHVDQRLHQKLLVARDVAVSVQIRLLSLLLFFLQQGDDLMKLADLLFGA